MSGECLSHFFTSAVYLINVFPSVCIQIPHIIHSWSRTHAMNTQSKHIRLLIAILRLNGVVFDQVSWMTASESLRQVKRGELDWQPEYPAVYRFVPKKHIVIRNTVQCNPVIWRIARLKHTEAFGCRPTAGHTRLVSQPICKVYGHNMMVRSKSVVSLGLQIDTNWKKLDAVVISQDLAYTVVLF